MLIDDRSVTYKHRTDNRGTLGGYLKSECPPITLLSSIGCEKRGIVGIVNRVSTHITENRERYISVCTRTPYTRVMLDQKNTHIYYETIASIPTIPKIDVFVCNRLMISVLPRGIPALQPSPSVPRLSDESYSTLLNGIIYGDFQPSPDSQEVR